MQIACEEVNVRGLGTCQRQRRLRSSAARAMRPVARLDSPCACITRGAAVALLVTTNPSAVWWGLAIEGRPWSEPCAIMERSNASVREKVARSTLQPLELSFVCSNARRQLTSFAGSTDCVCSNCARAKGPATTTDGRLEAQASGHLLRGAVKDRKERGQGGGETKEREGLAL